MELLILGCCLLSDIHSLNEKSRSQPGGTLSLQVMILRPMYACATSCSLAYCTERPAVYFKLVLIKVLIMFTGNHASFSDVPKEYMGVSVLVTPTTQRRVSCYTHQRLLVANLPPPAAFPPTAGNLYCNMWFVNVFFLSHVFFPRCAPPGSRFFSVKCTPNVQYTISPRPQEASHLSPIPLSGDSMITVRMSNASKTENDSKVKLITTKS